MENKEKPKAPLIGADGNIFNLLGICKKVLYKENQEEQFRELYERVTQSSSYDEALSIIFDYVEPYNPNEKEFDVEMEDEL